MKLETCDSRFSFVSFGMRRSSHRMPDCSHRSTAGTSASTSVSPTVATPSVRSERWSHAGRLSVGRRTTMNSNSVRMSTSLSTTMVASACDLLAPVAAPIT